MGSFAFDPRHQTYIDYVNQQSGFNQPPPQNSFPGETNVPYSYPPYPQEQVGPQPQQGPQQPPPKQQVDPVTGAIAVKQGYDTGSQIGSWVNPSVVQPSTVSTPVSGAPASVPVSQTESVLQGGDVATQSTPVAGQATGIESAGAAQPGYFQAGGAGLQAAGITAGAITGQQQLQGADNFRKGKNLSLAEQTALALPTFGFSYLSNMKPLKGSLNFLNTGKGEDQQNRDEARGDAKHSGWLDNNFQAPINDNLTLDLGKDGGYTYQNKDGSARPVYNMDPNDPNVAQATGWLQPLAAVLGKGDEKLTSDLTGQLYNEITKDGTTDINEIRKRVVQTYNHFQLKPSIVASAVNAMKLDPGRRDAYLAAIDNLRPGKPLQIKPGEIPSMNGGGQSQASPVKPMGAGALPPPRPSVNGVRRISPGIYEDSKGTYQAKDGVRG